MSISEFSSSNVEGILDQLRTWPSSERLRLVRRILDTLETSTAEGPPRARSLLNLLGLLKTDAPPPSDEECRALLEEELIKKHVR
jgi:hypothetical protein